MPRRGVNARRAQTSLLQRLMEISPCPRRLVTSRFLPTRCASTTGYAPPVPEQESSGNNGRRSGMVGGWGGLGLRTLGSGRRRRARCHPRPGMRRGARRSRSGHPGPRGRPPDGGRTAAGPARRRHTDAVTSRPAGPAGPGSVAQALVPKSSCPVQRSSRCAGPGPGTSSSKATGPACGGNHAPGPPARVDLADNATETVGTGPGRRSRVRSASALVRVALSAPRSDARAARAASCSRSRAPARSRRARGRWRRAARGSWRARRSRAPSTRSCAPARSRA